MEAKMNQGTKAAGRVIWVLCIVGLLLGTLFAGSTVCLGQEKIIHWTWLDPVTQAGPRDKALAQKIELFEKKYPDVKVEVTTISGGQIEQEIIRAVHAGKRVDVARVYSLNLGQLAASQAFLPLNEFVDDWSQEEKDDFLAPWDATMADGQNLIRFAENRIYGNFYRTDLLKEAGYDEIPTSWRGIAEFAAKITTDRTMGYAYPMIPPQHTPLFIAIHGAWAFGGNYLSPDKKAHFNESGGLYFAEWVRDLVYKYKAMGSEVATMSNKPDYMMAGTVGITPEGTNRLFIMQTAKDIGQYISWAPFPSEIVYHDGRPADLWLSGWSVAMPKTAKNPKTAWKYIDVLTGPEAELIGAKVAGQMPPRWSTYEDPWFRETPNGIEMLRWADVASKHARTTYVPTCREVAELGKLQAAALVKIIMNQATPKEALDEAVAAWNKIAK